MSSAGSRERLARWRTALSRLVPGTGQPITIHSRGRHMRLLIFCISAFFLIVVTAGPTLAEEPFTVLGVYQTRGDVMGIVVATDLKHKAAVFAVDVSRLNKPKVRLTLGFGDAEDWQQFAQIWLKARRTTPPREGFGTE